MNYAMVYEWIGYLASILIVVSMLMSSLLKLRIINLTGAALFSLYGFLIGALPVGFLNMFIVFVNAYFLFKYYAKKEFFTLLSVRLENRYLHAFINFYKTEINKFFPSFNFVPEQTTIVFFILRDMAVAGIFMGKEIKQGTLLVQLDFVITDYRDFKPGRFIYYQCCNTFTNLGYYKLIAYPETKKQEMYYQRMGFVKQTDEKNNTFYELNFK